MAKKILKREPSKIRLDEVHYAILITDEEGKPTVYGAVRKLPGAIDVTITPSAESVPQYSDNGVSARYSALGDISIKAELTGLHTEAMADWFGHKIDEHGGLVRSKDDFAPYIAFGFRAGTSENTDQYSWLYKAKAVPAEEKQHTQEGSSVTYTTISVTLGAEPRQSDGLWQYTLKSDNGKVTPEALKAFFDTVTEPGKLEAPTEPEPGDGEGEP